MTSIPPAEPRPPPLRPPDLLRSRTNSATGLNALTGGNSSASSLLRFDERTNADDRPLKRRKLDNSPEPEAGSSQQQPTSAGSSGTEPKRRLIGDLRVLSAVIAHQARDEDASQSVELPPLPSRPWKNPRPLPVSDETKKTHRARLSIEVPTSPDTKQDVVPVPPLGEKPAGYFPWLGRHPEDVLNEGNVKQGYYDRPPNQPERELSSARVPLYAAFKHKSGIDSLSTLFSLVLEAKNTHGLLSSASSFKPPPRVTLAEAKRRSWIADLADSNVPLRRLSRTIPQGIRGHILLEQCIQTGVPLSRAIWFAKCVGANEIRTLKRKGSTRAAAVGAESKWLREWTTHVEQFIETILSRCGQSNWKTDVQYTMRLVTRLYLENLLDRDHFLDWVAKSLSASDNQRLPFWLMIVHIYKDDLGRYGKRAKILVEGLVQKYEALSNNRDDVVQALVSKLRNAVRSFALSGPQCFVNPDRWPSIRNGLKTCLDIDHVQEKQLFDRLEHANQRCMGGNRHQYLARPKPSDLVVDILDEAKAPYDIDLLSSKLLASCPEFEQLVIASLEWTASKFRYGSARIYLVARLLRKWQRQDHNVESPLLTFMSTSVASSSACDFEALRHLLAELSRSRTFPMSMYLQWLNVRGLPRPDTTISIVSEESLSTHTGRILKQTSSGHGQVLMDLSPLDEKTHVRNQRQILLGRAGFDADAETEAVSQLQNILNTYLLDAAQVPHSVQDRAKLIDLCATWNWSVRIKLSHWLRAVLAGRVKEGGGSNQDNPLRDSSGELVRQFQVARLVLEALEDEAVLADVIGLYFTLDDENLHACLAETITRHVDAFSAIGALQPLQLRLYQLYMSLRNNKLTMPLFATALLDLCATSPNKATPSRLLQQDLVRGDRGRAIAASSPFSDGIAESLQQAESTFVEDFEAVLQSEPSMNEQTMSSLFALLIDRISKHSRADDDPILFTYCQLMARLRQYRRPQSDQLVKLWLQKAASIGPTLFTQNMALSMIGTGALTIATLVEVMTGNDSFTELLSADVISKHDCHYAVVTKWIESAKQRPLDLVNLLGQVPSAAGGVLNERQLYTSLIWERTNSLSDLSPNGMKLVDGYLKSLFGRSDGSHANIKDTVALTSTLSISFVQLRLQLAGMNMGAESNEVPIVIRDIVFDPSESMIDGSHISSLLQGAGKDIGIATRHLSEEHLLELLPKLSSGKQLEAEPFDLDHVEDAIERAFQICQASSPASKSMSQLIDKLSQLLKYLGHVNLPPSPAKATATSPTSATTPLLPSIASQLFNPSSPMETAAPRSYSPSIIKYLRILLHLSCLLRPSSPPSRPSSSSNTGKQSAAPLPPKSQSDQIKVLILLASLVTQPILSAPRSIFPDHPSATETAAEVSSFAYDVMATYVDELTDEGRTLCAKILKDKLTPTVSASQTLPTSSPADTINAATTARASATKMRYLFGSIAMFGSEMKGAEETGKGLIVSRKGESKGEWKPRVWEVLNCNGVKDTETSLGLGLFGARR